MVEEAKVDESGDLIAELMDIERRWMRQQYVGFEARRLMLRYALIGAAIERASKRVPGGMSNIVNEYIENIDRRLSE